MKNPFSSSYHLVAIAKKLTVSPLWYSCKLHLLIQWSWSTWTKSKIIEGSKFHIKRLLLKAQGKKAFGVWDACSWHYKMWKLQHDLLSSPWFRQQKHHFFDGWTSFGGRNTWPLNIRTDLSLVHFAIEIESDHCCISYLIFTAT